MRLLADRVQKHQSQKEPRLKDTCSQLSYRRTQQKEFSPRIPLGGHPTTRSPYDRSNRLLEAPVPLFDANAMAAFNDLPVELVTFIAHDFQVDDFAAFAQTSRKFFDIVDPILYKVAQDYFGDYNPGHPLSWAAENGRANTLKQALAAGVNPSRKFRSFTDPALELQSFQIRLEAVDGKEIWDPPAQDDGEEWEPREDDVDEVHKDNSSAHRPDRSSQRCSTSTHARARNPITRTMTMAPVMIPMTSMTMAPDSFTSKLFTLLPGVGTTTWCRSYSTTGSILMLMVAAFALVKYTNLDHSVSFYR